jgi:flagellar basal-body rod modification protein FlgD
LEGITNMGTSLDTVNNYMLSLNNFNATGLIGKDVKAYGNNISLKGGGTAELGYSLQAGASNVEVNIYDERGGVVKTIVEGSRPAGANTLQWDGRDATGNPLPAGKYTFTVAAKAQDGSSVGADTIQTGKVDGVVYEGGTPYLMIGNSKIGMSEVLEIRGGV